MLLQMLQLLSPTQQMFFAVACVIAAYLIMPGPTP